MRTNRRAERPPAITVTKEAAQHILQLMQSEADKPVGIEISVTTQTGCAGLKYCIKYAFEVGEGNEVIYCDEEGNNLKAAELPADKPYATIVILRHSLMYLIGSRLKFEVTPLRSGFTFDNPNETSTCGCGESFNV